MPLRKQSLVTAIGVHAQDLGIAIARIEEFRAILGVTRSEQFPTVDINATGGRTDPSSNSFPGNIVDDFADNYTLRGDVFWELDLFGRLRRSTEAARAQLLATEEAQRSITISLVASVASSYMLLRDLDAQTPIFWLGIGSNLLVRDGGLRGVVVSATGILKDLERVEGVEEARQVGDIDDAVGDRRGAGQEHVLHHQVIERRQRRTGVIQVRVGHGGILAHDVHATQLARSLQRHREASASARSWAAMPSIPWWRS